MPKAAKVSIIIVLILLFLFFVGGIIVGNIFYTLALDPHSDKSKVLSADHNSMQRDVTDEEQEKRQQEHAERAKWFEEITQENVYLTSRDNLRLHGLEILNENETNRWVIACHGYTGNAKQMAFVGKGFYDMGFNLLLPDARGHGESEGDYVGMGWDERLDITDWAYQIAEKHPDAEIVLYGVSMGGATVMMASGEDLPQNVKAIVEDCGYTSIWDEFSYQLKELFGFPPFPIMHFSSLVTKVRAGFWLGDGDALAQVEKCTTPMLFIHGSADTFVPSFMYEQVYEAATCPKEGLFVEGAGHGEAAEKAGDVYWQTIEEFINRYLN